MPLKKKKKISICKIILFNIFAINNYNDDDKDDDDDRVGKGGSRRL